MNRNKLSYDELIDVEISKFQDGKDQNVFFRRAIGIQNHAYNESYANYMCKFACDVLITSSFCNSNLCKNCKLEGAHEIAIDEIRRGIRSKDDMKVCKPVITVRELNLINEALSTSESKEIKNITKKLKRYL